MLDKQLKGGQTGRAREGGEEREAESHKAGK